MSKVYPGWKTDLLALVNKNNGLSLTETDVKFDAFVPAEHPEVCQVTIKPGDNSPYFFDQSLTYVRRDIANAFTGIPLRFIVSTDVAFRNIVETIAEKYGINFDLAVDFLETDLNKKVSFETSGIQTVQLPMAESSYVWSGHLQVQVINDKLDLLTIIKNYQLTELEYLQTNSDEKGSLALASLGTLVDLGNPSVDMSVGRQLPISYFEDVLNVLVGHNEITAEDKTQAMALLQADENRTVLFLQRGRAQIAVTEKDDWQIGSLTGAMIVSYFTDNSGKYILKTVGGSVNFDLKGWEKITIDWGDGNKVTLDDGVTVAEHTYTSKTEYTITATGSVKDGNAEQTIRGYNITEIVNWDNGMFRAPLTMNLSALRTVPNRIPEKWTSLDEMFQYMSILNDPNIQEWDVSRITSMYKTFCGCSKLNLDFSKWNVSRVTDMSWMFQACYDFVGTGLDKWDVSKVTNMGYMFSTCTALDGEKLVNWNTSKVTAMNSMFSNTKFNSDISGWDTQSLTDTSSMFAYTDNFNQDISGWNIINLRKVDLMFREAKAFNQDLSGWDVSNITSGLNNIGLNAKVWKEEFRPGYKAA